MTVTKFFYYSNFLQEFTDTDDGVPSLAIVLLPSSLPSCLPKHDYYLPFINPPSLNFGFSALSNESAFSESVVSDSAQYAWECLEVPHEKLIVLDPRRPNTIWDVTFFNDQEEEVLVTAFSVIFSGGRTRTNISNNQEKQHVIVNKWLNSSASGCFSCINNRLILLGTH